MLWVCPTDWACRVLRGGGGGGRDGGGGGGGVDGLGLLRGLGDN